MSNSSISLTTDDATNRFPSLASLRAAHSELLKRHRESGSTTELLTEIEEFIYRGRATGALLDSDEDRWASQSLLDYWSAIFYRAGREPPDATLAEFDPALAPELDDARCPYLGLEAFREEKSNLFYGRQRLLEKLVNHLQENRLLAVVGSSGSGKSSVVLAGLLPKLKVGALSDSENWHYYSPMVPGVNPLENLARLTQPRDVNATEWLQQQVESFQRDPNHLTKLSNEFGNRPSVLVVDQFEEAFTLCRDDSVRQAFIDNLIGLIQSPGVRHTVILTMRTDFESQVARVPVFKDLFEQAQVRVTALDASELREAIEKPAELVGLKFEEGLVEALLRDVLGEPAALPLLQFTLLKLWDNRERNRVTWETYKRLGGGRQALARSADEFYEQLIPVEQVTVKRILLRMVRPTEGLEVTSNRIQRKTLYQAGGARDRVDRVLDKLIQARLVRLTEGNTPDDAQVEIAHEALIYTWSHLVSWSKEEPETMRQWLHPQSFESERASRSLMLYSRRKGIFSFSSLLVFLSIISLFIFALHNKERLAEQREDQIKQQWRTEYFKNPQLSDYYIGLYEVLDSKPVANITFSPDKKLIAATSKDETVLLLNFKGEELADFGRVDGVRSVVFSPDGKRIATTSEDGTIRLWDLQGKEITSFRSPDGRLTSVVFSPDGKRIATTSEDGTIRLWDLQGKEITSFRSPEDRLISIVFSPDGKLIATASEDKTIRLWDLQGKEITSFRSPDGQLTSVVFSSDGKLIATTSKDGTMRLWNLQGNNIAEFSHSND
jgi:sugar lactone lactonase YvrE/energy-coupling factor transporter ATP-binding protein EcfA2